MHYLFLCKKPLPNFPQTQPFKTTNVQSHPVSGGQESRNGITRWSSLKDSPEEEAMLLAGATVIRSLGWVEGWTLKICYMALARGFSYRLLTTAGFPLEQMVQKGVRKSVCPSPRWKWQCLYNRTLEVTCTITSPTSYWSHRPGTLMVENTQKS